MNGYFRRFGSLSSILNRKMFGSGLRAVFRMNSLSYFLLWITVQDIQGYTTSLDGLKQI